MNVTEWTESMKRCGLDVEVVYLGPREQELLVCGQISMSRHRCGRFWPSTWLVEDLLSGSSTQVGPGLNLGWRRRLWFWKRGKESVRTSR
jgi:hypothetical protein